MPATTTKLTASHNWSRVGLWTVLGTFACVLASLAFNAIAFSGLGREALLQSMVSATALPILLGAPLFFYLGLRLRGLSQANVQLALVARTDSLTACLNRGAFTSKVTALLEHTPHDAGGALLMIDADKFKAINDAFGHQAGDEALATIARSIKTILRKNDLVGRLGGEEFGVFLPGADQRHLEAVAERIRRSVNLAMFLPDGRPRRLSVSIGGAVFSGDGSFGDLLRTADRRLYAAKRDGRNRVSLVEDESQLPRLRSRA